MDENGIAPIHRSWTAYASAIVFSIGLIASQPATADDDDEAGETKVEEFFQELFLGESVYPQDAGELQVTVGQFWNVETNHDSTLPVILEYGITDYFQVGVGLPVNFFRSKPDDEVDGVGNVELEAYWNILNNPDSGWAAGVGFGLGLPAATSGAGEDAVIYEPFVTLYRDFGGSAFNFSGGVEIEDPEDPTEAAETSGELAVAWIKRSETWAFLYLLEADTEISADETTARIAPGMYWHPEEAIWELGASVPVGLTGNEADIGLFLFFTCEFE